MANDVSEGAGVGVKPVFSFATLWGNVRKIHWNHSCWKVKHFNGKVTYIRNINAGKCQCTHADFLEGNQKASKNPGGPLPPPYLLKTNAALSAALSGCHRARSSGTFYLVLAYTYSEKRALFLVPFKCVRAASPEKTRLSFFIWLFPLITLSPSAGGGLSKQQKHQNFYALFSCGGENGGGGGGGV